MKKRILACMLSLVVAGSMIGCSSTGEETSKNQIRVGMVTDAGDIDDKSFNQGTWEGVEKAEEELGVEINYLKPAGETEAEYNIEIGNLYDAGYNLVICPGFKFETSIYSMQEKYQDAKFVIIDGSPNDGQGNSLVAENTVSIFFAEHEAGFLSGLAAALQLKEAELGFIGGMDIPVIDTFKYGYMAGVKKANSNVQIQDQFANSFTDQAKGKAIANQMYGQGADIIFIAGGDVGTGAIEAAKEKNKYAIGVDRDQSDLAPKNVLTSAIKRVDVGVYETVKDLLDGKFEGGTVTVYGLDQDAVGIAPTTKNLVPQDILDYVNQEIEKLKKGDIKVPKDKKEYDAMMK